MIRQLAAVLFPQLAKALLGLFVDEEVVRIDELAQNSRVVEALPFLPRAAPRMNVLELRVLWLPAAKGVKEANRCVPPLGDACKSNATVQQNLRGTHDTAVEGTTAAAGVVDHVERAQFAIQESGVAATLGLELESEAVREVQVSKVLRCRDGDGTRARVRVSDYLRNNMDDGRGEGSAAHLTAARAHVRRADEPLVGFTKHRHGLSEMLRLDWVVALQGQVKMRAEPLGTSAVLASTPHEDALHEAIQRGVLHAIAQFFIPMVIDELVHLGQIDQGAAMFDNRVGKALPRFWNVRPSKRRPRGNGQLSLFLHLPKVQILQHGTRRKPTFFLELRSPPCVFERGPNRWTPATPTLPTPTSRRYP